MNERTHIFIKIYPSHFILERVDIGCVWEVSWRRGQTATYWPKVLLTIAALLSHLGWVAQKWVTEGPKPPDCHWLSIRHLVTNWLQVELELTQAVCGTWLYNCLTHTCFRLFTQVHLLIDCSVEGQYVTLLTKINDLLELMTREWERCKGLMMMMMMIIETYI